MKSLEHGKITNFRVYGDLIDYAHLLIDLTLNKWVGFYPNSI